MNEMENLVLEEGTENVEATATEEMVEQVTEPEKVYTEEEFNNRLNDVAGKRAARKEAKVRKEYDREYGELIDVLKAGTGFDGSVKEITANLKDFYGKRGVEFKQEPTYSSKDMEVLARAEAEDVIRMGYEDVVEEINRYADIGIENLTAREKATLKILAEHQEKAEQSKELAKIGVTEDVLDSADFKAFASMFKSDIPITKVYEAYTKSQPKKEIKTMGSIKSTTADTNTVKDYYSYEEAMKFTKTDFDKNPALYEAVKNSMRKWSKK
jgi:hypothetical protein